MRQLAVLFFFCCGLVYLASPAVQAALVAAAQRPFVPFKARAFCTQQQRQQVASRLFGSHLVLLLQELKVPPAQQEQVGHPLLHSGNNPYVIPLALCSGYAPLVRTRGSQAHCTVCMSTFLRLIQHDTAGESL